MLFITHMDCRSLLSKSVSVLQRGRSRIHQSKEAGLEGAACKVRNGEFQRSHVESIPLSAARTRSRKFVRCNRTPGSSCLDTDKRGRNIVAYGSLKPQACSVACRGTQCACTPLQWLKHPTCQPSIEKQFTHCIELGGHALREAAQCIMSSVVEVSWEELQLDIPFFNVQWVADSSISWKGVWSTMRIHWYTESLVMINS